MKRREIIEIGIVSLLVWVAVSKATWDVTTPAGTESKSLGDDRIRELKTDIQSALRQQGVFPGADTANPRFMMKLSTVTTANRPTGNNVSSGTWIVNTSSNTIEQYDGTNWNAIDVVPSSSVVSGDLSVTVAGNGLSGGGGIPLQVNVDTNSFTITNDTITLNTSLIGSIIRFNSVESHVSSGTSYYMTVGVSTPTTFGATGLDFFAPVNGTLSKLYAKVSQNSFSANPKFSIYVNGSTTTLTTTFAAGGTSGSDLTHSVNVSAGDTIVLHYVPNGLDQVSGITASCLFNPR